MEVIKIVANDSQGLFQRILVELGRRKIEVNKMFMARNKGLVTVIIEADTGTMNGRLLHALMALQDINTAEYLKENYFCFWESHPAKGSDYIIACGTETTGDKEKAERNSLYSSKDKVDKN
jgi:hypothetical protein